MLTILLVRYTIDDYILQQKILDARKKINNQTRLLATLSSLLSQQTHIDKLESLKMEYYITARLKTMDKTHKGRK